MNIKIKNSSRTNNSIRNIKFVLIGQLLTIIISFIGRTIFVRILGSEYLGISGLFGNILSILSLAELGIGAAIIYSLYKPLAEHDEYRIVALMGIYRKTYTAIGIFILLIGSSLTPFLRIFVNEMPDIANIQLIYILYVIVNASTYFFSYKGMLINADQKQYLTTAISQVTTFLMNVTQITILYVTRDYILYLIAMIVFTIIKNLSYTILANRMYPFIKNKNIIAVLPKEETAKIVNNVKAMILHKLGGIMVDSTDNILLSKLVSVAVVGIYSNYFLIIHTLSTMYGLLFSALTSSVGNYGVLESKEKIFNNYKIINFAGSCLYGFSFICLYNLLNPFIKIWIGNEYLFSNVMVFFICLNFYLTGMRNSLLIYRNALGLFWYDRYKAVAEAIVNLIVSVFLGRLLGAVGIFIGTATSTVLVCLTVEPYIVYKNGFNEKVYTYYIQYLTNLALTIVLAIVVRFLISFVQINPIVNFLLASTICLIIPNIVYFILYKNMTEFKILIGLLKRKLVH